MTTRERLEQILSCLHEDENGCWVWTKRNVNKNGYAYVSWFGRQWLLHRLVYERLCGPIPFGLQIDHLCRNRICANPDHLEPVTRIENMRRGLNANKTECAQGHPFDIQNTGRRENGWRYCRTCARERMARRKAAA